ncbi:MAG: LysM peptidoglycan-binding domain-containing protein [Flavobacteriia bacterium]|nr:LysM peptidoglycan-binding domain-containing protein [Flavobacteriia bacterium]
MVKIGLLLSFLVIFTSTFAQPSDVPIEVVNGKKYYVHIVQGGNTLWGIHTMYNVPVNDIVLSNPGVENGVKEGQKLLIPVNTNATPINSEQKKHTVQAQETLYGISKKYGITSDELIEANPGIENGIKVGQELIIPESNNIQQIIEPSNSNIKTSSGKELSVVFSDTIIEHKVLPHETMYSISKRFMVSVEEIQKLNGLKNTKLKNGDIIKIPIRNEKFQQVEVRDIKPIDAKKVDSTLLYKKKDEYSIALLLPFFLDKQDATTKTVSDYATEFYMGAKLAIDSLENLGLKAKLYVYDSKNDTASVKAILNKKEFQTMDLVIGPLFPDKMGLVADWCKKNKVKYVCPVSANSNIIKNNPYTFIAIPSDATLMEGAAQYVLSQNIKDQIVLVKPTNSKDILLYESFRQAFLNLPSKGARPKLIEANLADVKSYLKKGSNVYFIVPTNDKTFALKFINTLNANAKSLTGVISVLGTKDWMNFDEISGEYRNRYNFQFPSPNDFNYSYEGTKEIMKKYRKEYNADMSKMAVQGFDVSFYFCMKYLIGKEPKEGVMTNFQLFQKGQGNGFENGNVYILKQQDFELIKLYESFE